MTEDPKYDRDKKFTSQDGEMEFLPVEKINEIKLETEVENTDEGDDELDLDEIDEEDLQDLADEEE